MRTVFISVLFVILASIPASLCLSVTSRNGLQYFDLSHPFDKDTIYFPGQREYELRMDYVNVTRPGVTYVYSAYSFCMAEHGGTHLDAPVHFNPKGWSVEKIPLENLIDVPAVLIDVENNVNQLEKPQNFVLEIDHIVAYEKSKGIIPYGSVVLIHFGWSKFWSDKINYLGWDNSTTSEGILNFPGLSRDVARWLAKERKIIGIGLDTASIDPGADKSFPAHAVLAEEQVYNLENVANLHTLATEIKEDCSLHLFVLPLNIAGGTGAPARILAYCK